MQAPVEIEILKELTKLARSGKLLEVSKIKSEQNHKDKHTYKPGKVVHVGHSFGSALTIGMLSSYGELSDGAILTGFVLGSQLGSTKTSAFGLEFAPASDARRFGDRPSGYLVQGTESSVQQIFLKKGAFEPSILPYAESIKQTATVGELLSGGAPLGRPAPAFRGPVQVSLPGAATAVLGVRYSLTRWCSSSLANTTLLSAVVTATTPMTSRT